MSPTRAQFKNSNVSPTNINTYTQTHIQAHIQTHIENNKLQQDSSDLVIRHI